MKGFGFVREVDKLGRIVIPKELRKIYNLTREVEIIATEDGVLIRHPKFKVIEIEGEKKAK